ncbi:leucine-rich repeat protein [Butyricicoccus pullicaecorum]|nr:leucine-rich repeat protein [Butyricicoccus pullicaecorum]
MVRASHGFLPICSTPAATPWEAFCGQIESVELSDGITAIGANAFAGYTSLWALKLPASVTTLSNQAFSGCSDLSTVYFYGQPPVLLDADGQETRSPFPEKRSMAVHYLRTASGWDGNGLCHGCIGSAGRKPDPVCGMGSTGSDGSGNHLHARSGAHRGGLDVHARFRAGRRQYCRPANRRCAGALWLPFHRLEYQGGRQRNGLCVRRNLRSGGWHRDF